MVSNDGTANEDGILLGYRVNSTSEVIPRSSASQMESPSHFSSSARTLAALLGPFSSDVCTGRVSLRYDEHILTLHPAKVSDNFLDIYRKLPRSEPAVL